MWREEETICFVMLFSFKYILHRTCALALSIVRVGMDTESDYTTNLTWDKAKTQLYFNLE